MPAPRDWAPEEPAAWLRADDPAFQRYVNAQRNTSAAPWVGRPAPTPSRRSGGAWGRALFALVLGIGAIWSAVTPLLAAGGAAHGYLLSSIGLIAVFFGVNALRRNRIAPNLGVLVTAVAGIGAGVIGTVAMLGVMVDSGSLSAVGSFAPPAVQGGSMGQPLAQLARVQLSSSSVTGAGRTSEVVVGNGGTVRLEAGYSVQASVSSPRIEVRLERSVAGGAWSPTGVTTSVAGGAPLSAVTPPYSTSAATEVVQYRFASAGSTSSPVSVVYENQRFYTGMAATIYGYAAPYCPTTAVHITALSGREAGQYAPGTSLILIDTKVGFTVNLPAATQRSLAVHECSHELQWLNYGSTDEGYDAMKATAATDFSVGSNGAPAIEHAADCGAMAVEPNGYLGYGGYCTPSELQDAARLLGGEQY